MKILLWTARITGSIILAFLLFFVLAHLFGTDESDNGFSSTEEILTFICFPISTIAGLSTAYKWPGLGGLITVIGCIGLFVLRSDLLDNI